MYREGGALVDGTCHGDPTSVGLSDSPRHEQPESDARNAFLRSTRAPERFEDVLELVGSDAHALIGDLEHDGVVAARCGNAHLPAARRVLDRVAHEVGQHLLDPPWIAGQGNWLVWHL